MCIRDRQTRITEARRDCTLEAALSSTVPDPLESLAAAETRSRVWTAMLESLSRDEARVVRGIYGIGRGAVSRQELSEEMEVGHEAWIRAIERNAMTKLREWIAQSRSPC